MKEYSYVPKSVSIPTNAGIERKPLEPITHETTWQKRKHLFDSKTLFYDVFFRSGRLICIGPPLASLGRPRSVTHKGKKLKFKLESIPSRRIKQALNILTIECGDKKQGEFKFEFTHFTTTIFHNCQEPYSLPKTNFTAIVFQKDNPVVWIEDWITWHYKVHNIKRIIVYDNGSKNLSDLRRRCRELDSNIEIAFIHWPYKYGTFIGDMNYKYAQVGAINHFRILLGSTTKWCMHLDIDEYLCAKKGVTLQHYISQPEILSKPVIYLPPYMFPFGQQPPQKQIRFFHHQKRYKGIHYWHLQKWICQPHLVSLLFLHGCRLKSKKLKYSIRDNLPSSVLSLYHKIVHKSRQINSTLFTLKINAKTSIHNEQIKTGLEMPALFFYHCKGLYTGWRGEPVKTDPAFRPVQLIPSQELITDTSLSEKAKQVGMIPK